MGNFAITIDGKSVEVSTGDTVLVAARKLGIDIPTLCYLEKCGPLNSCLVCLVKIKGKLVPSCGFKVEPGMVVESETVEVHEARRTALELLFSDHVGDCLSPCHRLCPLKMNIPLMLRQVQAGKMLEAIATVKDALPLPAVLGRLCHHPCEGGCRRASWDNPAAIRDIERRVADDDRFSGSPRIPACKPSTGKSVVIVGAGPAGLAAAHYLLRQGHACTVADRNASGGGTLRKEAQAQTLRADILDFEITQIRKIGADFKFGVSLGIDLSIEGLLRGFNAVLIAIGESGKGQADLLGLETTTSGIKAHPETFQTKHPAVFATGRCVRGINQLLRAMSDGVSAAESIHQYLSGQRVEGRRKPFSSIMGRLDKEELDVLLHEAEMAPRAKACDLCAGNGLKDAQVEASRCLHCDCRASGNCALQSYAQIYQADASRFRQPRQKLEQYVWQGGVIFEPGKCIRCGICVKLTELAREPLGLTFIGRGFDVRIAAPFNFSIEQGLQKTARECVESCPTGALAFA